MADQPESAEPQQIHLTAWHVFLVELVKYFTDERRLDVKDFDKLGTLPLEADVMLLRKRDLAAQRLDAGPLTLGALAFLEPRLGDVTALEYKGPTDVLDWEDVDTARVYALLGKRKYKVERDSQVRVMMMYSHARKGLFDRLADDGLRFDQEEEGILCHRGSIVMYAMDLVILGKLHPHSPLNLVSARHRQYVKDPDMDRRTLALVDRIEYLISVTKHGRSAAGRAAAVGGSCSADHPGSTSSLHVLTVAPALLGSSGYMSPRSPRSKPAGPPLVLQAARIDHDAPRIDETAGEIDHWATKIVQFPQTLTNSIPSRMGWRPSPKVLAHDTLRPLGLSSRKALPAGLAKINDLTAKNNESPGNVIDPPGNVIDPSGSPLGLTPKIIDIPANRQKGAR